MINEFTLTNTDLFKKIFKTISKICEEITLQFTNETLIIGCMNHLHILMMNVELSRELFDTYQLDEEQLKVSFSLTDFNRVLSNVHKDEILKLRFNKEYLLVNVEGKVKKSYRIKLLDEHSTVPELDLEYNYIQVDMKYLREIIHDCNIFSKEARLTLNQDYLLVDSTGLFTDAHFELDHNNMMIGEVSSKYDLSYLLIICSVQSLVTECYLGFEEDGPLSWKCNGYDGLLQINFFVAPRIDAD